MQASPWTQRLPLILRFSVIAALVGAGGWAFTEAVVTIDEVSADESVHSTLSNPLVRWIQVVGTALCVAAVAGLSWSPSVRIGAITAAGSLVISAVLAAYAWVDTSAVTPDSLLTARDLALQDCTNCTATVETGLGTVVAFVASLAAAAGSGFIALMAEK